MKKIGLAVLMLAGTFSFAQQNDDLTKEEKVWYHQSIKKNGVYGVDTEGAYKYLQSKGLKPVKVIVSVIDSGVEVDHPGLKPNMWVNKREIPGNNIDDDKNGYVDDIHGWNFLGGKEGDVNQDNLEATRVVRQYKDIFEGPNAESNKIRMPKKYEMYEAAKLKYEEGFKTASQNFEGVSRVYSLVPVMQKLLGNKPLNATTLAAIKPSTQQERMAMQFLMQTALNPELQGKPGSEVVSMLSEELKEAYDYYASQAKYHYNLDFDPRYIVGDDYTNVNERYYGNNHYEGPDALHGTHVAGIIAGVPNAKSPQYGVASKVAEIMTVRAVPDGDERDKDIANAIRYSVDNGAKVINMSFGKGFSPNIQAVWDAIKYAQSKGVLLVHAAGNDNKDIGKSPNYPTNFYTSDDLKPFVNNMITVGASTEDARDLRASFSNFNTKMVDVFAPGQQIYSTVPDGKYKMLQGTSMASPVVAGAAAVLLAYMPTLTPQQIIESLVKTTNVSDVALTAGEDNNHTFRDLSVSGGVIDLRKAAEYAYTRFYKKR